MPMPPPPADALTITGKPMSRAAATASSGSPTGSEVPRETGTPAAATRLRARILSPIASIASGDGPTQTSPASWTRRAKLGVLREEAVPGVDCLGAGLAGGLQQRVGVAVALRGSGRADADGSSASRTYGSRASASECTATARRPIRCTVRMMRRAISPRLATSTVSNTGGWPPRRKWVGRRD